MTRAPLTLFAAFLLSTIFVAAAASAATLEVSRQAGGEPGPMVAVGAHLYQALGPAIVTSTSDASAPATLSITAPLPGLVLGLAEVNGFLYALVRSSLPDGLLAVYSLADPAHPALVAIENYSDLPLSSPSALLASGGRLYLADLEIGILVVDLTDPADPDFSVGFSGSVPAAEMALSGGRLVAWGQNFFGNLVATVFDLTTPTTPSELGSFSAGLALGGAVDGNFFYSIGFGLEIFDFSDLGNVQSVFQNGDAASRDALVHSGRLYFGNATGLHVWDIGTPASANEIAVLPAALDRASQSALVLVGADPKLVFATQASRGLRFAAGISPALEFTWDLPGGVDVTALADPGGDEVFITDFYSGLRALSRADLESRGRLDVPADQLGAVEGLAVVGNRVYLANWGFGLLIGDITDPESPALLGSVEIPFATAVAVVGTRAYVVTSTNGGFLVTVDVADPENPQILSSTPTTKGMDVLHHNGVLLVADEAFGDPGGLRIYSLVQPSNPAQIGHYTTCDSAAGVEAVGARAYLACTDGSLHIVDIANPANPVQLGAYLDPDLLGGGRDVAVRGNRAFFARGDYVDSVLVANPASPALAARIDLGSAPRRLEMAPAGQIWVAGGQAGVFLLDQGLFADGFESGDFGAWFAHSP